MVKRIVRRKVVSKKKSGEQAMLEQEVEDVMEVDEAAVTTALDNQSASADVAVAERLRQDAMRQTNRNHKSIARFCNFNDPIELDAARGTPTCAVITEDGEWLWYGDKNGNVFRYNLSTSTEFTQIARHKTHVLSMAITFVPNETSNLQARGGRSSAHMADAKVPHMLASGSSDGIIKVFDADSATELHELQGHRGAVTGLAFRLGKNILYSGSYDRTLKVWDAENAVLLDTFYGHTGKVTSVASGWREEVVTAGDDRSVRLFKVEKGTQSAFQERSGVIESVSVVNDDHFIAAAADGSVCLYNAMKRRALNIDFEAHGKGWKGDGEGLEQVMSRDEILENTGGSTRGDPTQTVNWVSSTATVPYSDLAASGGVGGAVNIYELSEQGEHPSDFVREETTAGTPHRLAKLRTLAVPGIVNSLFFNRAGTHLVCTVTREQRLGRWLTQKSATNKIFVYPITLEDEVVPRQVEVAQPMDVEVAQASEEGGEEAEADVASDTPTPTTKKPAKKAARKLVSKPIVAGGAGGKKKIIRRRVMVPKKRLRQIVLK